MDIKVYVNLFFMIDNFLMMNHDLIKCLAPLLERYRYQQLIRKISIVLTRTFLRSKFGCPANFIDIKNFWKMLDAMVQKSRCEQPLLTSAP